MAARYIGKQFVDNTSNPSSALDPYLVTDVGVYWTWHNTWANEFRLGFMLRNAFNEQYESNGWIYRFRSEGFDPRSTDPYSGAEGGNLYHLKGYFPQAGRNFYINLSLAF
jgi:iron complex outermembrane receptor protein